MCAQHIMAVDESDLLIPHLHSFRQTKGLPPLSSTDASSSATTAMPPAATPHAAAPAHSSAPIKATTMANALSEMPEAETSGTGAMTAGHGDSSLPALDRVERLSTSATIDKEDDRVLIPPRPLAQWGVCCLCYFNFYLISCLLSSIVLFSRLSWYTITGHLSFI